MNKTARLAVLTVLVPLVVLPWLLPERDLHLAIELLISGLFAMSLGLIMGQGGMTSLGHAAFFGVGGYAAGLMALRLDSPFVVTLLVAPALAALAGGLIGFLAVRRSKTYLLMLTFALGQLTYAVFFSWRSLTGGDDGLIGIQPPTWLLATDHFYWFSLVVVIVCLAILYQIDRSPFGYGLRAARDSVKRAHASGIDVRRQQIVAFIIAGYFAGVSGALSAYFNRAFFPGGAHWLHSAEAFVSVIIGGPALFLGPLVGAIVLGLLSDLISRYTVYWFLFLGICMILIALLAPNGLTHLVDALAPRLQSLRGRRSDKTVPPPAGVAPGSGAL